MKDFLRSALRLIREYWLPFIISFASIALVCGLAAFAFLAVPGLLAKEEYLDEIKYTLFGEEESISSVTLVRDGVLCIDFEDLALKCGMSVSGDSAELTIEDGDGKAVFTSGSRTAEVNGNTVTLERAAEIEDRALWLPLSFVENCISGLSINLSEDLSELSVEKDGDTAVCYTVKENSALLKVTDNRKGEGRTGENEFDYDFANDLDAYKKYLNPDDREACLLYYSPDAPASSDFVPPDLVTVRNAKKGLSLQLSENAEKAIEAMFIEMNTAGFKNMQVTRAYVSYAAQKKAYDNYIYNERMHYKYDYDNNGKTFSDKAYALLGSAYLNSAYINKGLTQLSAADAKTVVSSYCSVPGSGDHMLGLSVDLSDGSSTSFGKTEAYQWLCENAYKFGFIERYPEGDKKLTGFDWDPNHWRFVGQYHAEIIHRNGYCLEEYISLLGLG